MIYHKLANKYKAELLDFVLPFWQRSSQDLDHGGFYTCLLRDGQVFDTDKFIWLQARQVWTFAMLYNSFQENPDWLKIAENGANFLQKYGRDSAGNWYFSVNQQGQPLVQAYNIFSDCFATMAFGQLYVATKKEEYAQIAVDTFNKILDRQEVV